MKTLYETFYRLYEPSMSANTTTADITTYNDWNKDNNANNDNIK